MFMWNQLSVFVLLAFKIQILYVVIYIFMNIFKCIVSVIDVTETFLIVLCFGVYQLTMEIFCL